MTASPNRDQRIKTAADFGELVPRCRATLIDGLGALAAKAIYRTLPAYAQRQAQRRVPPPWESSMTEHLRGRLHMAVPKEGPTGRDRILQIPECWALATNDGGVTYAVHGTSIAAAQAASEGGFRVRPRRNAD